MVLLGDFDDENEGLNVFQRMFENSEDDITTSMDEAFVNLCEYLICEYNIEGLDGHNNVPNNTTRFCPGRKVLERIPVWRMELGL